MNGMKIYTGTGDRGKTSLFSGERVSKADRRVEAYGAVDELNSVLGALAAALEPDQPGLVSEVRRIQADLFRVGARLAFAGDETDGPALPELQEEHAAWLERAMDRMEEELPPLKGFILPGGHASAAWAHIARTVCRRAERHVVSLRDGQAPGTASEAFRMLIVYLNRLSDYLFLLARKCNRLHGQDDIPWGG